MISLNNEEVLPDIGNFPPADSMVIDVQEEVRQGRPKRGRKRKIPNQSRADRKRLLNHNMDHINRKGELVKSKVFDEGFVCACLKNCPANVDIELRKKLFSQFYSLGTYEGRCAFLLGCVSEKSKNRTYTKGISKRQMTRQYSIFGRVVCKIMFLRTLQINQNRVNVALKKLNCDTFADGRGKLNGGWNALSAATKEGIRSHISSFPKYISHYNRSQTDSRYLHCNLNLRKIFDLYKKKHEDSVSFSSYKRIFYDDFNLRFKKPKKDTCLRCDIFKTKLKNPTLSFSEIQMIEKCHNEHIDHAVALKNQMDKDLALAKADVEVETLTFDLQKTHSLPKLTTSIVYYLRQLNLYNLGIHVGSTSQGIFNIWLEFEASKGTQEVGSCLRKFIFENIKVPVKKLILWSDSCGGQNRSIKLTLFLIHILQNHPSLESISLRFRQSGNRFNHLHYCL